MPLSGRRKICGCISYIWRSAGHCAWPLMFLIYINGVGVNIKSHIRLFADDTHLYPTVSSKHDANTLQQDLDSLVAWTKL